MLLKATRSRSWLGRALVLAAIVGIAGGTLLPQGSEAPHYQGQPRMLRVLASMIGAEPPGYARTITLNGQAEDALSTPFGASSHHADYNTKEPVWELKFELKSVKSLGPDGLILCQVLVLVDKTWTITAIKDSQHGPSGEGVVCHALIVGDEVVPAPA